MQFKLLPLQFVRHPNVLCTYCLSDLEGEILRRGGGISLPSSGGGGTGWCSVELGLMSGGGTLPGSQRRLGEAWATAQGQQDDS